MFVKFKKWFNTHRSNIAITLFIVSIIILLTSLITKNVKPAITTFGCALTTIGMILTLFDKDHSKKRGFEVVREDKRKSSYFHIPTRSTSHSAAYDFYCNDDYVIQPNEIIKIWTDVKAYMKSDEVLILNVRSSMGGKFMLANTQGWVDSDYYGNIENDGNICLMLKNISNETQSLEKGSRVVQGMFIKYLIIDNDDTTAKRKGGLGSSGQ